MDIILDQIAIWLPCGSTALNVRRGQVGERFRRADGVVYQIAEKQPLIRYAKDYTVKKVNFSLFVRTFSEDKAFAESELDRCAKEITKEYALKATANATTTAFEYTPFSIVKETK